MKLCIALCVTPGIHYTIGKCAGLVTIGVILVWVYQPMQISLVARVHFVRRPAHILQLKVLAVSSQLQVAHKDKHASAIVLLRQN